jgi:hypothetical protein
MPENGKTPPLLTGLLLAKTAYLRVAHMYMLISMPTDTSTIFGAFQAISLSICVDPGEELALTP